MNSITVFAYSLAGLEEQAAFLESLGFTRTDSLSDDYNESGSQFCTLTITYEP